MVGRCSPGLVPFPYLLLPLCVADVGGISLVLCCCYHNDCPDSPLQFGFVFVDLISLSWSACQERRVQFEKSHLSLWCGFTPQLSPEDLRIPSLLI